MAKNIINDNGINDNTVLATAIEDIFQGAENGSITTEQAIKDLEKYLEKANQVLSEEEENYN